MTKMIQLRALRPFPYGKHRLAVGEVFDVNEKLGAVFIHEGRAALPEEVSPVDLPAEVMQRTSRREPVTEVEEEAAVTTKVLKAEAVEEDAAPKSATYHRRDMVAEAPKAQPPKKRGRPGRPKKSQS